MKPGILISFGFPCAHRIVYYFLTSSGMINYPIIAGKVLHLSLRL